ncbi:hypothetical protein ACLB2K_008891 [Fragaria x ananassa]
MRRTSHKVRSLAESLIEGANNYPCLLLSLFSKYRAAALSLCRRRPTPALSLESAVASWPPSVVVTRDLSLSSVVAREPPSAGDAGELPGTEDFGQAGCGNFEPSVVLKLNYPKFLKLNYPKWSSIYDNLISGSLESIVNESASERTDLPTYGESRTEHERENDIKQRCSNEEVVPFVDEDVYMDTGQRHVGRTINDASANIHPFADHTQVHFKYQAKLDDQFVVHGKGKHVEELNDQATRLVRKDEQNHGQLVQSHQQSSSKPIVALSRNLT